MKPNEKDMEIKPQGVTVPFHNPTEAPNTMATITDSGPRKEKDEIENISTVFGE